MNKILLLTIALSGVLFFYQKDKEEIEETENSKVEEVYNVEDIEKIFSEFKILYAELLKFKDNSDFKTYGFAEGGPYNKWLNKVEKLINNPDSRMLLQKGIVAGELEQLGLAYVSSKGQETEVTRIFNKYFSDAISSKQVKVTIANINYGKLQTEYVLFGKWEIVNSTIKSLYPYEIYKKGNEYVGVIPEDKFKTEILEKKGDKYSVKWNKYGEYYMISANKEMTLFDMDGDLASMGYKAIKK